MQASNAFFPPNAREADVAHHGECLVSARSRHTGGVNAALADGSVQFISDNLELAVWRNLHARNDGQVVSGF